MVKYFTPQVTKMANGNYQYSIRYRDASFDGVRKKSVVIKKNTTYAKNNAEKIVKNKIMTSLGQLGQISITFGNLSQKYFGTLEKRGVAYKTITTYRAQLNQMNKVFKDKHIATITTVQINRYLDDILYKRNLTNKTAHSYQSLLNQIFSYAKQFGYIADNPMNDVKINYKDESQKRQFRTENWYLSDDEMGKIVEGCEEQQRPDYRDFILWLYLTGMRIGEGSAIQVQDIYQKDHTYYAKVNGTLIRKVGIGLVKQPYTKTKSSSRDVALPQQAVDLFLQNSKNKTNDSFLFVNKRTGNPFSPGTLNPVIQNICKNKGIDKHITSHIFRHTHVSKLSELGYPLDVISKRVGHENEEITRKIYLHITNKKADKFNELIKDFKF